MKFLFEIGEKAKDKLTGFKGVVVCRSQYLTGCNRYSLQSTKLNSDGKPQDWVHFDESQLVSLGKQIEIVNEIDDKNKGGPRENIPLKAHA